MVYLPGNEAAWAIVNQIKWRSQLSEDKIVEFLTKTELKKCKNMQNILSTINAKHVIYFLRIISKKKNFFFHILKLCREIGTLKYFERIFKQFELINWTFT